MIIDRITTLYRRKKAARALGMNFDRGATFQLPESVLINGDMKKLSLPDEHGVRVAFVELLLDDCYGCRKLQKNGEKIETVLDIGGNVGLFGIAARNAFPAATIHAYEPNRQLEAYLSVQAKAGEFDYFMEAVGLEKGTIALDFGEESVLTRSKQDADGDIPQTSFREAIMRLGGEVDLLKIDCEGAEWEIFKDKESWKRIKHLAMEYHLFEANQTEQRVREIIEDLGFVIDSLIPIDNFGLLTAERK